MKRTVYILMTVIFTSLTIGVNITKHFSGDELYSISVDGEAKSCCEVPCDCCSDVSVLYQLHGDYIFSSTAQQIELEPINLILFSRSTIEVVSTNLEKEFDLFQNSGPPFTESKDYLSLIQTFLL